MPDINSSTWMPDWAVKSGQFVAFVMSAAMAGISHRNARSAKRDANEARRMAELGQIKGDISFLRSTVEDHDAKINTILRTIARDREETLTALAELKSQASRDRLEIMETLRIITSQLHARS